MKRTAVRTFSLLVILASLLAACYWGDDVRTDQVGIKSDGGQLKECLSPGIYSDSGLYTDLIEVPVNTLTFEVADPSVATKDTQIVGITVAVQARRKGDCDSVKNLLTNWTSLLNDDVLIQTISATTNEAIKTGTRALTLEQLLNDRNGLSDAIVAGLEVDTAKYNVEVINVSIKDVKLDPAYEAKLNEKANITADIDIAIRNQDKVKAEQETARIVQEQRAETLAAQLLAEQAQTNVEVEIAAREGKKIDAANTVYKTNEQAFELERIRQLRGLLSATDKVYFVPEGTDLTLFLSGLQGTAVPVP